MLCLCCCCCWFFIFSSHLEKGNRQNLNVRLEIQFNSLARLRSRCGQGKQRPIRRHSRFLVLVSRLLFSLGPRRDSSVPPSLSFSLSLSLSLPLSLLHALSFCLFGELANCQPFWVFVFLFFFFFIFLVL